MTLDFEGRFVTLGSREAKDLACVLLELESKGVEQVILWGTSMGAVTALLYEAFKDMKESGKKEKINIPSRFSKIEILGNILDSPFSSLNDLSFDLVKANGSVVAFLLRPFFNATMKKVRKLLLTKAEFDIKYDNFDVVF